MAFSIGDRVQILPTHHWAQNAKGTVEYYPLPDGGPTNCSRQVGSLQGMLTFYWVRFDEPQTDAEGESGYSEGEIDSRYLLPAPPVPAN